MAVALPPKPWSVYLIECADGSVYTGTSNDVPKRYEAHCTGKGARYTKSHKPVRLIGAIRCGTKGSALTAECAVRKVSKDKRIRRFA